MSGPPDAYPTAASLTPLVRGKAYPRPRQFAETGDWTEAPTRGEKFTSSALACCVKDECHGAD